MLLGPGKDAFTFKATRFVLHQPSRLFVYVRRGFFVDFLPSSQVVAHSLDLRRLPNVLSMQVAKSRNYENLDLASWFPAT